MKINILAAVKGVFTRPVYLANEKATEDPAKVWKSRKKGLATAADDASDEAHAATAAAKTGGPEEHLAASLAHHKAAKACDGLAGECNGQDEDEDDAGIYEGKAVGHKAMARWHAKQANGGDELPAALGKKGQIPARANEGNSEGASKGWETRKGGMSPSEEAEVASNNAAKFGTPENHLAASEAHRKAYDHYEKAGEDADATPGGSDAATKWWSKAGRHAARAQFHEMKAKESGHANERTTKALAAAKERLHLANEISFADLQDDLRRLLLDNPAFKALPGSSQAVASCGPSPYVRDVLAPEDPTQDWSAIVSIGGDKLWKITFDLDDDGEPELTEDPPVEVEADTMYVPVNGGEAIMPDAGMGNSKPPVVANEMDREVENDLLANDGTSEGAQKGWETRKGGATDKAYEAGKVADEKSQTATTIEQHQEASKAHGEAAGLHQKASKLNGDSPTRSGIHAGEAFRHGEKAKLHDHKVTVKLKDAAYDASQKADAEGGKAGQASYDLIGKGDKATPLEHTEAAHAHLAARAAHLAATDANTKAGLKQNVEYHQARSEYHQGESDKHAAKALYPVQYKGETRHVTVPNESLANEGAMAWRVSAVFANMANEDSATGNWILLAPYGDHPHVGGTQRFTREDAANIVNEFRSLLNTPRRLLGCPIYVGHPDSADFSEKYKDTRAYGRLKELEARDDGLWGNAKWSNAGKEMVNEGMFSGHSVNWRVRRDNDGYWRPVSLKSLGLTNEPNIDVPPILRANEAQPGTADLAAVNATLNEWRAMAKGLDAEVENDLANAAKCDHLNPDGSFVNGFDGCVLHMQSECGGGHSEESAKKICGSIAAAKG